MDSITQIGLGAAVGVAVMGRSQPVWKSALFGAVAGTLPDLDAFVSYGDDITEMVRHRGETHSIFWQTLAAPAIALVFALLSKSTNHYFRWWIMVWLVLLTHAGLDAMTVYGTQLFLPRDLTPVAVGSIFVIDPLYTLPLFLGLAMVLFTRAGRHRWNFLGLLVSTVYLGWTLYAQQQVTDLVMRSAAAKELTAKDILVTPTPFNSVLWRIVLVHPDRYEEGFYSLVDSLVAPERPLTFNSFSRDQRLDAQTENLVSAEKLRRFTKGFYSVSAVGDSVRITDLRMGQHPYFAFSFEFARLENGQLKAVLPRNTASRASLPVGDYARWLFDRARSHTMSAPPF
ncbi:MAG: metal-dependent hydrolase [Burkholderiaceae bacterium]